MLVKNLKIALRNIGRHKVVTLINIAGLSLSVAICILVFLFIKHETSFDSFHEKGDRIYRLTMKVGRDNNLGFGRMPYPLGPILVENIPEVEQMVRWHDYNEIIQAEDHLSFQQLLFVDQNFLQVFSFPLIAGNPSSVLDDPNSIVISREVANTLFVEEEALGKIMAIQMEGTSHDLVITGIVESVPDNSSIQFDFLIPIEKLNDFNESHQLTEWASASTETYLLLQDGVNPSTLVGKIDQLRSTHRELQNFGNIFFQPIQDIHYSGISTFVSPLGSSTQAYILASIGVAVLLIACINFVLLSLALQADRVKEIGIRKTIGAAKSQLVNQFLGETLLVVGIAIIFGLILVELFLPIFNQFVQRHITLSYIAQLDTLLFIGILCIVLVFAVGGYPAFYFSRSNPVDILQNKQHPGKHQMFSNSLIVIQFSLAIFFIFATILMSRQMQYLSNKELGFEVEQTVVIPTGADNATSENSYRVLDRLRVSLMSYPAIEGVSGSFFNIGDEIAGSSVAIQNDKRINIDMNYIGAEYPETMNIQLSQGRSLNQDDIISMDQLIKFLTQGEGQPLPGIVNQAFVNAFGWNDAIGQEIKIDYLNYFVHVIGVVDDYHFESLHSSIQPIMLVNLPFYPMQNIYVRFSSGDIQETMGIIRENWQEVAPDIPFEPQFLDDRIDSLYQSEKRWNMIIQYAAIFTLFVSCLGLFGLAAISCIRRTKEIGIRKVVGASVGQVVTLLSKEFLMLVIIANVIAWPIAWYAMRRWLENFAYRIELGLGIFIVAGLLALVIALATVSWQTVRAATANPVESLRYE